jgi:ABC-type sugar transport system substrate-binding protein
VILVTFTVLFVPTSASLNAKIPLAEYSASATDPNLLGVVKGSPYFVGSFGMDGVKAGYDAAQTVYDAGCRNICYIAPGQGNETHDQWVQGIEKFAAEHTDFIIVSSSRDAYTAPSIDLFRKTYSAFPNIECVIETSNDQTLIPGLYTDNLQSKVKYATLSLPGDVTQAYKDGCVILTGVGASGYIDPAFAALYNTMSGNNLITDNSVPVIVNYITISNSDEYEKYLNTVQNEPFFSADELKEFCPAFNPDANYEDFVKACAKLSFQDIIERHNIS